MGYAKVIQKEKNRKESIKKMDKCLNYQNNGYLDAHLKRRRKR